MQMRVKLSKTESCVDRLEQIKQKTNQDSCPQIDLFTRSLSANQRFSQNENHARLLVSSVRADEYGKRMNKLLR